MTGRNTGHLLNDRDDIRHFPDNRAIIAKITFFYYLLHNSVTNILYLKRCKKKKDPIRTQEEKRQTIMSEQFENNNENKNSEYHFTGEQLNQVSQDAASQRTASGYSAGQESGAQSGSAQSSAGTAQYGQEKGTSFQNSTYYGASRNAGAQTGGIHGGAPHGGSAGHMKKPKKPMTTGKKWAMVVSMALVFGLIAGGTMFGVNTVGNLITGRSNHYTELSQTQTTSGSGTSSSSDSASGTVTDVAQNAMPSLVTISTMSVEEMRSFFGGTQQYEVQGAGTGVIVGENDTELLIATNYHVVEGATSLSVGFIDEQSVEGEIKGTDVNNDLAVVAVKLSDIPDETMNQIKIATIGDSDSLQLGDQVVAIGNALGYGQSVTSGYVSALNRDLTLTYADGTTIESTGLIQTDAAINSGNSGGALLNMNGELIGINEAKSSSGSNGASVDNIGFAIPIDKAQSSLQEMMNMETRERVDASQASYMGIQGQDVSAEASELYGVPAGAVVVEVVQGSPADKAGIQQGDIITELDGRTISGMSQLQDTLQYYAAGETVDVVVQRSGDNGYEAQTLSITLGSAADVQN